MDFKIDKLLRRIMELSSYRYVNRKPIEAINIFEDRTKQVKRPTEITGKWELFDSKSFLEGRDCYYWFKFTVQVPELKKTERMVILADFAKYIGGRKNELEGFEALAFVDGKIYQGLDQNHKELFIDHQFSKKTVEISMKLWTGLEAGGSIQKIEHRLTYLDSAQLDMPTDDFYFNTKLLFKAALDIKDDLPEKENFLSILDKAFLELDWSFPGDNKFYESINRANTFITDELTNMTSSPSATVTGIGHTHIDVAWLWQLKHTREKAARSFSTVLRLMEDYPDYTFLQSQPQLYDYIKEDYPELYAEMKDRISEGRWEADGAAWLEPDCNLPSGESLIRQILMGSEFVKKEYGKKMNYLWLPDVFGYSWALPQILKKSGIDMLMTTKLSWNQFNRMPNDTFIWRGIDGSEIYTHFITTPNPNSTDTSVGAVYSGLMEPATVKGIYRNYKNNSFNRDFLLAYGHGDGGGGTDREMAEMITRMSRYSIPTLPEVSTGTAKAYFEQLKQNIQEAPVNEVETWDGELYLEYHRGTYTSQADNKHHNRRLELLYRDAEWLNAVSVLNGRGDYQSGLLRDGWKIILRNQFHDILPGCAIKEVYEDSHKEYDQAYQIAQSVLDQVIEETRSDVWTIFNTAAWNRSELVFIEGNYSVKDEWTDECGEIIKAEVTETGVWLTISNLEAMANKTVYRSEYDGNKSPDEPLCMVKEQMAVSPHYKILWNDTGQLTSIYDIENDREVLKGLGNRLELFEDKPMAYDAWDIDIYYQEKGKVIDADKVELIENTSLYTKIRFDYTFGVSRLTQDMILYKDSKRIDFETHVDWQERQQLLKAGFQVDIRSVQAAYDIQFGHAYRSNHWNTSWDKARFESVGHQWADLSETGYGVSLLNDSKYGYDIKDNQIRLSLLTSAVNPNPDADRGEHTFIYSLYPHVGEFLTAGIPEAAWGLNNPLKVMAGKTKDLKRPLYFDSEDPVFVDCFKQAEDGDGFVLRIHDHTGGKRKITLRLMECFTQWCEISLIENEITDWNLLENNELEIDLKPFEIMTIKLK